MLAKETKIHNLILQREVLKKMALSHRKDGDPAFRYIGYIYPENRKYFEGEGYDVTTITSIEALKITEGLPLNIFTPFDEIKLTPEEEKTSQNIVTELLNISEGFRDFLSDLYAELTEDDDSEEFDIEDGDIPEDAENYADKEEQ